MSSWFYDLRDELPDNLTSRASPLGMRCSASVTLPKRGVCAHESSNSRTAHRPVSDGRTLESLRSTKATTNKPSSTCYVPTNSSKRYQTTCLITL